MTPLIKNAQVDPTSAPESPLLRREMAIMLIPLALTPGLYGVTDHRARNAIETPSVSNVGSPQHRPLGLTLPEFLDRRRHPIVHGHTTVNARRGEPRQVDWSL